ncbi:pectinesterase-like isoform X2 [Musa acuminata AAA Group]|uniref:pectinesterase-like isoform X2 n=1 Tax=Musa acuminata AAA Group TaxID=214697 RepID=UPI0031D1ABF7
MASDAIAFFLLSSFFLLSPVVSVVPLLAPVDPSTACNSTLDPKFCKTVLPPRGSNNLYEYGRFSVAKSLSNARKFLHLINRYLAHKSNLSPTASLALLDCQLLSELNIDILTAAETTLNDTDKLLDHQADKVHTLLSALVTNQHTCSDGLHATESAWSIKNGLSIPMHNSTKLYGVSLALFKRAWEPHRKNRNVSHSRVPRRKTLGRGLLQATDAVLVNDVVRVSQDGSGNFVTITDAVKSAPVDHDENTGYHLIYVAAGVYEEYVVIPKHKKHLMMIGDGINQTVITGNHSVGDGWTTFTSSTFVALGHGFVAINITFRNAAGPAKYQAVAVLNNADMSTFYRCSFEGYQDTLYTHSMRQFYRECDIYGTVDYIFGNAAVVFQNCNVYSRLPLPGQINTITAQGRTDPNQNTGTSMQSCNFLDAADLAATALCLESQESPMTYLGRPWKPYSRTVVMQSYMDSLIEPAGWVQWNSDDLALNTLYYAEYNNSGPGSGTAGRVDWPGYLVIGANDAINFTVSNFISGDQWLPMAGVPHDSGLV